MKKTIFLMILLVLVSSAFAYPLIYYETGVDKDDINDYLPYISKEYFKYVNRIDFVKEPIIKRGEEYWGWYNFRLNERTGECYYGRIWIYDIGVLRHELCHLAGACLLKEQNLTEEFADSCDLKKLYNLTK